MNDTSLPGGEPSFAPQAQTPREQLLKNATGFLSNPQVKASPLSRKVNFLRSKGLTNEEIAEAFKRCGQPQSVESIDAASKGTPPAAAPAVPQVTAVPNSQAVQYASGPQYAPQPQYPPPPPAYPYAAQPPPSLPASSSWGWKDYFVAGTVATISAGALVLGLQTYSPFTITRKERISSQSKRNRRYTSASEEDAVNNCPPTQTCTEFLRAPSAASFVNRTNQPSAPAPPPAVSSAEVEQLRSNVQELSVKLEAAQKEASDTKQQLEKEQREKAELAVTVGKLRGQLTQSSRVSERNAQALQAAQDEVAKLKKELDEKAPAPPAPAPPQDAAPPPLAAQSDVPPSA